jgi:hypothetical protein
MMVSDDTDLAYAAGLIDGEGSIAITRYKARPKRQEGYRVNVQIGMCDAVAPMWMQLKFGGTCKGYDRLEITHRRVYRWQLADSRAVELLALLLPYLKTKRVQAEIALEYQRVKMENRKNYIHRKPLVFLEAEAILAGRVSKLNQGLTEADDGV